MSDSTKPSPETRAAEREEANARHVPDREPTDDENAAAETLELDPEVVAHEKEMAERGANQKGEGRIS
jgi:hypothetical protein